MGTERLDSEEYSGREQDDSFAPFATTWHWRGGALAGLVATLVMGVVITLTNQRVLQEAIAGLYGQSGNLLIGWVAHLVHGVLFGVLFAAILTDPSLYRVTERLHVSVLAGVVFGLVLAVVGAGIIMPMWLDVVAPELAVPIPNVTVPLLVWHLLYGVVLGGVFPYLEDL